MWQCESSSFISGLQKLMYLTSAIKIVTINPLMTGLVIVKVIRLHKFTKVSVPMNKCYSTTCLERLPVDHENNLSRQLVFGHGFNCIIMLELLP